MKKVVRRENVAKYARILADHYYPSLKGMKINVQLRQRERKTVDTIKWGMQKIVTGDTVNIIVTEAHRHNPEGCFGRIIHELAHADQIVRGDLSFDGMTYIYQGQRYTLKYRFYGSYEPKAKLYNYIRMESHNKEYWAPWEQFDHGTTAMARKFCRTYDYVTHKY